jgi:hypothetical protein
MPQSNFKRSGIMASKGDAGTKLEPSVEPQSLLGNVFQRVMNLISGNSNEEDEDCLSDPEAPMNRAFFNS